MAESGGKDLFCWEAGFTVTLDVPGGRRSISLL